MPHQPHHDFHAHPLVPTVLVSVGFGLAAGAVGMLLAAAYILPAPAPSSDTAALPSRVAAPAQEDLVTLSPSRSAVLFFDAAPAKDDAFSSLVPANAFGAGFVLTSDGWLLAHAESFPRSRVPAAAVAVVGGQAYPVESAVRDPFTGVLFLKITASNLPVTAFGASDHLPAGGLAYSFDEQGDVRRLVVGSYGNPAAALPAELLSSSERMQKVIRLTNADDLLPGSMILSPDGEVAALLVGRDAAGAYAAPFDVFSAVIGSVLRDGQASRPLLGIRYVDLSRLVGVSGGAAVQGGRGALVSASSDGRLPAVLRGSPAGLAGIGPGDVILAVNGEEISAKTALADLIAEYAPGSQVTLTVADEAGERRIDVTLGTAPAP